MHHVELTRFDAMQRAAPGQEGATIQRATLVERQRLHLLAMYRYEMREQEEVLTGMGRQV
jgi:hypothetical protein